ncbi:RHS repeat-associated core domain-containing protein [Nocardia sp. CC227C]|uniref:RHS repeat-associated core domain-containing protein n=1 Tax=Nocardia sp. CC227C TaxID=3044562 RepID=UPI0035590EC7
MTDVWTPDQQWWNYTYDALGRRLTKQHVSTDHSILGRVDYTWDDTHLIEQCTNGTTKIWHYQPSSFKPIIQVTHGTTVDHSSYAIVADSIGTPICLFDSETAHSTSTAISSLWGSSSWHGTAETSLRFPGQIYDPETGFHYNLHRYYNPATAQYLSADPLGLLPASNPRSYPHNPTVWSDPLGLVPERCREPTYGNGGHIDNISPSDARRIQNAANLRGVEIHVVGSRASGTAGPWSDWDYSIPDANSRMRSRIKGSLPQGSPELGYGRRIDIFPHPPAEGLPYVTFYPN